MATVKLAGLGGGELGIIFLLFLVLIGVLIWALLRRR